MTNSGLLWLAGGIFLLFSAYSLWLLRQVLPLRPTISGYSKGISNEHNAVLALHH